MPEPNRNPTPHAIPPKRERVRKIKAIQSELEMKRRELGLQAPSMRKGPVFYLVLMVVLAVVGLAVINATDSGKTAVRVRNAKVTQAMKSVDAFAEALGRFKFHCGVYPTADEGLEALALKQSRYPGWIGPYIKKMVPDPWKHPYVYEPSTNGVPRVFSLGPDGIRGTADDITPDATLFQKPFRDTTWTNNWAPYQLRGYIIVPSKTQK